jgi:hypothetical protein
LNDSSDIAIEQQSRPQLGGVLARVRNLVGAPRRQALTWLRPKYVEQQLAMRKGDCNRCGLCCQLVFKCQFLRHDDEGLAYCGVYKVRPSNCRVFPIDQRDIDDVNRLAPHAPCGYSFKPPCGSKT